MPGKGGHSKKPGLHLGGWVPPGKDSGPGDRQPLGQASHQKKQEKHQGGATGLWGTVGWARGPAEVGNRVSGLAGDLPQHRATCTHLAEEGRRAEAPSKTGVQVPKPTTVRKL